MNNIMKFCFSVLTFSLLLLTPNSTLNADELAYQEHASEIIFNSLKNSKEEIFLTSLYKELLFTPVWMREKSISPATKELFEYIHNDDTLNRDGKLYQDSKILENIAYETYSEDKNIYAKISLELKISQLYKAYIDYAYFGSINWGAFNARISNLMVNDVNTEWVLHRPEISHNKVLSSVAFGESLKSQLDQNSPTAYRYEQLKKVLVKYLATRENGGWQTVYLSSKLTPNKYDDGVNSLRERLRATEDYSSCIESDENSQYDNCLQDAVKHFQKRNGLVADGVVGTATLQVLNETIDEKILKIRLNLDRIKWLNVRDSNRHVIINIPDFKLYFEEDEELIQTMRVVTGTSKHPTPIFSDTVEYIVLNPYWNIPKSIIQKEMIPKLMRNSNAMAKQGIEIYTGWGKDAKKISGNSVNWSKYRYSKSMPFRFAQVPGNRNALGKVKFLFPNKFSVYMHDTPSKHLFKRSKRSFSHGCIRLHKPRELLYTFSTFNENIDFDEAKKTLDGKKKKHLALNHKVPVDVIYLTAWIDYDGKLQFRDDVYNYDEMQLKSYRRW